MHYIKYLGMDVSMVMMNAFLVRSHACQWGIGPKALGRSKSGFVTKIHACSDAAKNSIKFLLTPRQHKGITTSVEALTEDVRHAMQVFKVFTFCGKSYRALLNFIYKTYGVNPVFNPVPGHKKVFHTITRAYFITIFMLGSHYCSFFLLL